MAKWFLGGPQTHPAEVRGKFTFCPDNVEKKIKWKSCLSLQLWTSNTFMFILSQNWTYIYSNRGLFSVYAQLQTSGGFGFFSSTPDCVSKSPPLIKHNTQRRIILNRLVLHHRPLTISVQHLYRPYGIRYQEILNKT